MARRQLTIDNTVAAELAGSEDAVLRALEGHLDVDLYLRGNVLTLDGDAGEVRTAETVVGELVDLIEQGHEIAPGTIEAVTGALDKHESPAEILEDVVWQHRNTRVAPKTVNQKQYVDSIRRHTITFGIGPAGTGKTFLAVAMAAAALSRGDVSRVILTRPAVEAGERLGFLPGDIQAKVDPYLRPLFDALYDMLDPERVNSYFERGTIEVAPLAFMRGRTLNDSFVILDEAQNTSPEQMKMFLTRLGFGSKLVVTGDITQIDLEKGSRSGLVEVGDILTGVEDINFIRFGGEDVVRHKLVQRIVAAYGEAESRTRSDADGRRLTSTSRTSRATLRRAVGAALHAAGVERRPPRRARSSARAGCARSTTPPAASTRPPTCSRSQSTTSSTTRAARAGRRLRLPGEGDRRDRGGRARHAPSLRLRPRDRQRGDARAAGQDLGFPAVTQGRVRRPRRAAERRQVDAGQRDRRRPCGDRLRAPADNAPRDQGGGDGLAADWQLVMTDLPGVQRPRDALTERMQRRVEREIADSDAVLFVVNAEQGVGPGDRFISKALLSANAETPVVCAVNKVDRLNNAETAACWPRPRSSRGWTRSSRSAPARDTGLDPLIAKLVELLPGGPVPVPAGAAL